MRRRFRTLSTLYTLFSLFRNLFAYSMYFIPYFLSSVHPSIIHQSLHQSTIPPSIYNLSMFVSIASAGLFRLCTGHECLGGPIYNLFEGRTSLFLQCGNMYSLCINISVLTSRTVVACWLGKTVGATARS